MKLLLTKVSNWIQNEQESFFFSPEVFPAGPCFAFSAVCLSFPACQDDHFRPPQHLDPTSHLAGHGTPLHMRATVWICPFLQPKKQVTWEKCYCIRSQDQLRHKNTNHIQFWAYIKTTPENLNLNTLLRNTFLHATYMSDDENGRIATACMEHFILNSDKQADYW